MILTKSPARRSDAIEKEGVKKDGLPGKPAKDATIQQPPLGASGRGYEAGCHHAEKRISDEVVPSGDRAERMRKKRKTAGTME